MKKKLTLALVMLVLIGLCFPVANLVFAPDNRGALGALRPADGAFAPVAALLEDHCASCHVQGARLPFYAGFPIAAGIIAKDIATGLRFLDMKAVLDQPGQPVSEVFLAKIEQVVQQGTMPPGRYKLLHWDAGMGAADQKVILDWVHAVRSEHYTSPGVATRFALEPVQPLVAPADLNQAMVTLGGRLFHDVRLSGDDTISCASCHALDKGGTDQRRFSKGIRGQLGGINAPTVFNSSLALRQFWDGRARDLVEQAGGPVTNPVEMGANWPAVLAKLGEDAEYPGAFAALFEDGISAANIQKAIAEFEKSLVTTGSKFDRYLMGAEDALSAEEAEGYAIFKERGCATCHVGQALGGRSFEIMGLAADYFAERGEPSDADQGLFNFTQREGDQHKFKVPTLRNVALTWPYFHDGSTSDLGEAVRTMGKYQKGVDLTGDEVRKIVAFLESLTGEYAGELLK